MKTKQEKLTEAEQARIYRRRQFEGMENDSQYLHAIQIVAPHGGRTKWLSISKEEFEAIRNLLTR